MFEVDVKNVMEGRREGGEEEEEDQLGFGVLIEFIQKDSGPYCPFPSNSSGWFLRWAKVNQWNIFNL